MKKKLYILLVAFPLWELGGLSCTDDDDTPQLPRYRLPTRGDPNRCWNFWVFG